MQLIIPYKRLITTRMHDELACAILSFNEGCRALRIVEKCLEDFDDRVRMLSITAVLGSHEFWCCI